MVEWQQSYECSDLFTNFMISIIFKNIEECKAMMNLSWSKALRPRPAPCALRPAPCALRPAPYAVRHKPCALARLPRAVPLCDMDRYGGAARSLTFMPGRRFF